MWKFIHKLIQDNLLTNCEISLPILHKKSAFSGTAVKNKMVANLK